MLYQDNYLAINVKLNFCQRQTHCIDDQDTFQSVTDTDNEFTECQTRRKNLVRLHEAMQEELKTASFSEQIQIFTLVRDKWSQMYC